MGTAYLDASILIPIVQSLPAEKAQQSARLAERIGRETTWVVSDLVRMECRVRPLARGDWSMLADVERFFASPEVVCLSFPSAVFDRAAAIRAQFGYRTPDALHLAVAVEAGCDAFVTADRHLEGFTAMPVTLLTP
ncbi:MAG: type II toxin-antitoxin system VapC family toxin [Armatimonadetes bacterium]|nr:type II toxin-antitoxin system VapC family toxin [Armatimonadota bacterium]